MRRVRVHWVQPERPGVAWRPEASAAPSPSSSRSWLPWWRVRDSRVSARVVSPSRLPPLRLPSQASVLAPPTLPLRASLYERPPPSAALRERRWRACRRRLWVPWALQSSSVARACYAQSSAPFFQAYAYPVTRIARKMIISMRPKSASSSTMTAHGNMNTVSTSKMTNSMATR
jgi:hypothetical protein